MIGLNALKKQTEEEKQVVLIAVLLIPLTFLFDRFLANSFVG